MPYLGQATLLFYVESQGRELISRVLRRLTMDYSPAAQTITGGDGNICVTSTPIYLEEFHTVVSYLPRLVQLFTKDGQIKITAMYATDRQLVEGTTADEPHGIYIGFGAFARVIAIRGENDGSWLPAIPNLEVHAELMNWLNQAARAIA